MVDPGLAERSALVSSFADDTFVPSVAQVKDADSGVAGELPAGLGVALLVSEGAGGASDPWLTGFIADITAQAPPTAMAPTANAPIRRRVTRLPKPFLTQSTGLFRTNALPADLKKRLANHVPFAHYAEVTFLFRFQRCEGRKPQRLRTHDSLGQGGKGNMVRIGVTNLTTTLALRSGESSHDHE